MTSNGAPPSTRDRPAGIRSPDESTDRRITWHRSFGNENWEFDESGLMAVRIASINDVDITEGERRYHWPLGRRPDDHPSLSELGF